MTTDKNLKSNSECPPDCNLPDPHFPPTNEVPHPPTPWPPHSLDPHPPTPVPLPPLNPHPPTIPPVNNPSGPPHPW